MPSGCETVLIGGQRAARVGDKATCGAPMDVIAMGEPTVLIGGPMAARMGDPTAHGGVIVQGEPTVWVGGVPGRQCLLDAARARAALVASHGVRRAKAR